MSSAHHSCLGGYLRWVVCLVVGMTVVSVANAQLPKTEDPLSGPALYRDVREYAKHSHHRTATKYAHSTSEWIASTMEKAGYETGFTEFGVLQFDLRKAKLVVDGKDIECMPMWYPRPRGPLPVEAPLVYMEQGTSYDVRGKIALAKSKQTLLWKDKMADLAAKGGARGLVMAVDTVSGEVAIPELWPKFTQYPVRLPILLVGTDDEVDLLIAAKKGLTASFTLDGGDMRPATARNVHGKLDRGDGLIIVSTEYTAWQRCVGERGTGLAMFLGLAEWAARRKTGPSYLFVAFTGGELGHMGFKRFIENEAPKPEDVTCWLHIGSSAAARAWDKKPEVAIPLQELSPYIRLESSDVLMPHLKRAFKGVFGLTPTMKLKQPVLKQIIDKDYAAFGIGGDHFFRGTFADALPTASPTFLVPISQALSRSLESIERTRR